MSEPGLAIITGGSAGIGAALARQLHARGWRMHLRVATQSRFATTSPAELGLRPRCLGAVGIGGPNAAVASQPQSSRTTCAS